MAVGGEHLSGTGSGCRLPVGGNVFGFFLLVSGKFFYSLGVCVWYVFTVRRLLGGVYDKMFMSYARKVCFQDERVKGKW